MGTLIANSPGWELANQAMDFLPQVNGVAADRKTGPVEDAGVGRACFQRRWMTFTHKCRPLHNGLKEGCGSSGKFRPPRGVQCLISKPPELHSRYLEIPPLDQPIPDQLLRNHFHFSCDNYGDYCFLNTISSYFRNPPPLACRNIHSRYNCEERASKTGHARPSLPMSARESRDQACFPPFLTT